MWRQPETEPKSGTHFAMVPMSVLADTQLTNAQKLTYGYYAAFADRQGFTFVSAACLSAHFPTDSARLTRNKKVLKAAGFLFEGNGHKGPGIYLLDPQPDNRPQSQPKPSASKTAPTELTEPDNMQAKGKPNENSVNQENQCPTYSAVAESPIRATPVIQCPIPESPIPESPIPESPIFKKPSGQRGSPKPRANRGSYWNRDHAAEYRDALRKISERSQT